MNSDDPLNNPPPVRGEEDAARRCARNVAIRWAGALTQTGDWVVLDTETTGPDVAAAEAIEIAVVDSSAKTLLDTLVKPPILIPADSTAVHDIREEDVADAPTLVDMWPKLCAALEGKRIVAYNAAFDVGVLRHSAERHQLPMPSLRSVCVMEMYARFRGECDGKHEGGNSYRPHKLEAACQYHGIEAGGHRAAGGCRATLALIQAVAASEVDVAGAAAKPTAG